MSFARQTVRTIGPSSGSVGSHFFVVNSWRLYSSSKSSRFFSKNSFSYAKIVDATLSNKANSSRPGLGAQWLNTFNKVLCKPNSGKSGALKSSFFPFVFSRRASHIRGPSKGSVRDMATHRDIGYGNSYSRGGNSGGYGRMFESFKAPLAFTAAVLVGNYILMPVLFRIPGGTYFRRHPDHVVYCLIGINIAGFLAWKSPITSRFMYRYGLLHKDAQFNVWGMIGSAFSHQEIWHLGLNMFALYQFGVPVARMMGSEKFLEAYLDSAVIASLGSLVFPVLAGAASTLPSLGASGAVFSMFGIFSYIVPGLRVFLLFIPIPLNAWYVFLGSIGYSAIRTVSRNPVLDHAGHLGGCLAGLGWGYYLDQKRKQQRQRRPPPSWGVFST